MVCIGCSVQVESLKVYITSVHGAVKMYTNVMSGLGWVEYLTVWASAWAAGDVRCRVYKVYTTGVVPQC